MPSFRALDLESTICVAEVLNLQHTCRTELFSSNEDKKGNEMESENVLVPAHSAIIVQFPNEFFDCVQNLRCLHVCALAHVHTYMYTICLHCVQFY